jgi:AraC family transcriptional regulator
MQTPRIEILAPKKVIGKHLVMSHSNDRTGDLWRSFMSERRKVANIIGQDLFSVQLYPAHYDFQNFNPDIEFTKWAAAEVSSFENVPEGMDAFYLSGGLYAVFIHHGTAAEGARTFGYIFGDWIPNSKYAIDDRPHFELLGSKYKNNDPLSEEEIWIPITEK